MIIIILLKLTMMLLKNHIGKEYQYLLFCNNDIKLLSDVISGMLDVYKEKSKVWDCRV